MKKLISILIAGILALGLVACGSKQTTKEYNKENINQDLKQEDKKDEKKESIDLKNTELNKGLSTVIPLEITQLREDGEGDDKGLFVELNTKDGSVEQKVKDFYTYSNVISGIVSSDKKYNCYKRIAFTSKQLGGILMYTSKESVDNFLTFDSGTFGKEEYQKIFDKLIKEEK
ncbi:LptM family lipoprotein [Clostridium botulinum]|uniref:LptM family lipoprotein n=1 Tax=Clostridium botulinum TaxID=1491 RepID=UPI00223F1B06|nr:hypothetical protein [Clostridium botulinum]